MSTINIDVTTTPRSKIFIEDESDGFAIIIEQSGERKRFRFNQEDTREALVNVFQTLGFGNVTYTEVY
jgi:hypothetical protein